MEQTNNTPALPLRVRGKRRARPEVKWNYGKQRDPKLQQRRPNTTHYGCKSALVTVSEDATTSSKSRPRQPRRRYVSETPLEALPPEVLQTIFAYSANIMLPLTSTQLAFKLCNSSHLRHQLSNRLLDPVLGHGPAMRASASELAAATRLLDSRFMDFAFFKSWLLSKSEVEVLMSNSSSDSDVDWKALWLACQPSPGLLPPYKLLCAPFSADKTAYLAVLAQTTSNIRSLNSAYGELAQEGLAAAVQAGYVELTSVLLGMGVSPTTELLRAAVIDAACDERLVKTLLRAASSPEHAGHGSTSKDLDLLDPMIWSWADQARTNGNPKGNWLMSLLRDSQEQHAEG